MRLIAIGDLSLNGYYHRLLSAGLDPLRAVHGWQEADLVVGNLESPITRARRVAASKCTLRGSPDAYRLFDSHRFDVLAIANNHMMDFGPEGLVDTKRYLDSCGIKHCGGGSDLAQASAPVVIERCRQQIGFLSFCDVEQNSPLYAGLSEPGVSPWLGDSSLNCIRRLRPNVEWLVVMLHWGVEMSLLPTSDQREVAARIIAAGADVILGCHPHVLQPIEEIDGKVVAYSLGNCLFSPMYWQGLNTQGEKFFSKLRLDPLSRRTGWLEIELSPGAPLRWSFHEATLKRSLVLKRGWPRRWRDQWHQRNQLLGSPNYENYALQETERGTRRNWHLWNEWSLLRRIEVTLQQLGVLSDTSHC